MINAPITTQARCQVSHPDVRFITGGSKAAALVGSDQFRR
jgi:hypothetical protein